VTGDIRFLPVHIHCIANDYRVSIMFWKIMVSSKLTVAYWLYMWPRSCSSPSVSTAFFTSSFAFTFCRVYEGTYIFLYCSCRQTVSNCYFFINMRPFCSVLLSAPVPFWEFKKKWYSPFFSVHQRSFIGPAGLPNYLSSLEGRGWIIHLILFPFLTVVCLVLRRDSKEMRVVQ